MVLFSSKNARPVTHRIDVGLVGTSGPTFCIWVILVRRLSNNRLSWSNRFKPALGDAEKSWSATHRASIVGIKYLTGGERLKQGARVWFPTRRKQHVGVPKASWGHVCCNGIRFTPNRGCCNAIVSPSRGFSSLFARSRSRPLPLLCFFPLGRKQLRSVNGGCG